MLRPGPTTSSAGGTSSVQLKRAISGQSFAEQEAVLAPPGPWAGGGAPEPLVAPSPLGGAPGAGAPVQRRGSGTSVVQRQGDGEAPTIEPKPKKAPKKAPKKKVPEVLEEQPREKKSLTTKQEDAFLEKRRRGREQEREDLGGEGLVTKRRQEIHRDHVRSLRQRRDQDIKSEVTSETAGDEEQRGSTVRKRVVEESGDGEGPTTLHEDQGPSLILAELRQAMVDYVLATRAKEELRTELGVKKLKKSGKKKQGPTAKRITKARLAKKQAFERYDVLRKAAEKYLSETQRERHEAFQKEIRRIDGEVLGVSNEQDSERQDQELQVRKEKLAKVGKIKRVTKSLALSECEFGRLQRRLKPIADAGVGSRELELKVGVSFSLGIGKGSKIKIGGGFIYRGKTDIQDDRRLRVTSSYGGYGSASAQLAAVVEGELGAEYMHGKTDVYIDVDHWAADLATRMKSLRGRIEKLKSGVDPSQIERDVDELVGEQGGDQLLATRALANHDGVTSVTSNSVSGGVQGGVLGMSAGVGMGRTWMTFERGQGAQKKRRQAKKSELSFNLSPASNVGLGVTWTSITGHPNPDNDGEYINFKLSLAGKAAGTFGMMEKPEQDTAYAKWEKALRKKLHASQEESSEDGLSVGGMEIGQKKPKKPNRQGDVVKFFSNLVGGDIISFQKTLVGKQVPFEMESTLDKGGKLAVEWNHVFSRGQYRLQYRRISTEKGKGLSGSVPVGTVGGATASVEVGVSKSETLMRGEKLGTETATYLQTVFDGLRLRDIRDTRLGRKKKGGGKGEWASYVASHEPELWTIFAAVGARKGGVYNEIKDARDEAVEDLERPIVDARGVAVEAAGSFLEVCQASAEAIARKDPSAFTLLSGELTAYFEAQAKLTALVESGKWEAVR